VGPKKLTDQPPDRLGFFSECQQGGRLGQRFLLAGQLALQVLNAPLVRMGLLPYRSAAGLVSLRRLLTGSPPRVELIGIEPRFRQYSARSATLSPAVSTAATNLSRARQPAGPGAPFGNNRPWARACARQGYNVAAEMPSSSAR
jgi:hypothetical protein